jgi:signal transduction histidine kinase
VKSPSIRSVTVALTAAALLAAAGFGWEAIRFGLTDRAAEARLEAEVRALVADRSRQVESLAERVSQEGALVAGAAASPDELAPLFTRLSDLARASGTEDVSVTVYMPAGPAGEFKVLAWSDGPAEDVTSDRLLGGPALFVAPGTVGLRLIYVEPVNANGRQVGIAAAETVLSPASQVGADTTTYSLETAFGPVVIIAAIFGGGIQGGPLPNAFVLTAPNQAPLLEVRYSPAELAAHRRLLHRRIVAIAVLPLIVLGLLSTGPCLDRRGRASALAGFVGWSVVVGGIIGAAALVLVGLGRAAGVPVAFQQAVLAFAAVGWAALFPVSWWWRRIDRWLARDRMARFALEILLAGGAIAVGLFVAASLFRREIDAASLDKWQFPLFPVDPTGLLYLVGLLLGQVVLCWTLGGLLGLLAARWRLQWRRPRRSLAAAALWLAPTVGVLAAPGIQPLPWSATLGAAGAFVVFGVSATAIRTFFRHASQAMRMVGLFGALFVPTLVLYPLAAFYAESTARTLIEANYAPAVANYPEDLGKQINRTESDIDRIAPTLVSLVAQPAPLGDTIPTSAAFQVWKQTSLARTRVTADVELYGPDRRLVSRFALNVPEYRTTSRAETWQGTGCTWEGYSEVAQIGAEDRRMLHADRGLCDDHGRIVGAVVVHVVPDYQALPFVSSANPYYEVLGVADASTESSRVADLQVVVYGWSFNPLFASGHVAWPISHALYERLYRSHESFWVTLSAENRPYDVYFASDRDGIYALGYPVPTLFEHASRLAEALVLTAVVFLVILLGATAYAPFARRRRAPLRLLLAEIRTSYYRKLFLFFVGAAVVPVLLLSLAVGAYMTGKFRADVESEASSVVTVARRFFDELTAVGQRPDQQPVTPTDDVMVLIRQVIGQDVNLFEGPRLVATSQRDLFDSGLLPMRTPAAAYRAITLDRLPTFVAADRLGTFQYLVAAAPVQDRDRDRDALLSVPLALRQREIEREIDELNRGVLVGAVLVVLFAAGIGASMAGRVSDPVARLTRATRQIAAGRLDVRLVADTSDELGRLVEDFNSMAGTLVAQREALARTNQLKAWAEMARQVAHEIKNPLTPIQLAAEHLDRIHEDQGRPLGPVFDQCVRTVLRQVRLLRQIASEFSTFAGEPTPRPVAVLLPELIDEVVGAYQAGLRPEHRIQIDLPADLPTVWIDRTLVARALTNLIENALQAMPDGGLLSVSAAAAPGTVTLTLTDTGVGMDADALQHAFEPYFSTKTGGAGLGLANAKRNIELSGGSLSIASTAGRGTTVTVRLPTAPLPGASAVG